MSDTLTRRELEIYRRLEDQLERVGEMASTFVRAEGATDREIFRNGAVTALLLMATDPVFVLRLARIVRRAFSDATPALLASAVLELHAALPAELLDGEGP